MRLFIAIPVPPDVRRAAAAAQDALRNAGAEGRFVPEDNFHVTLHFLGETDALSDAAAAVRTAVRDIRPFVLRVNGLGGFGGGSGRTAYLALRCDTGEMNALYESLESALWENGFSRSRSRLVPHITLGRNVLGGEGADVSGQTAAFTVGSVVLYESRNERGRMIYSTVHTERLT